MTTRVVELLVVILCVLGLGVAACRPVFQSEKEEKFHQMYPDIPMNQALRSVVMETALHDRKAIILVNHSNDLMRISGQAAHQIYLYAVDDREWNQIDETLNYINDQEILLYPKKDRDFSSGRLNTVDISILPDLAVINLPIDVRVVVVGEVIEGYHPTGKEEGTYIDITYQPPTGN